MNIDKLILANLVGEVMEEIVEWINNLWITCGLLAGLVDPQSPVPEVVQTILWQCLCRSKWSVG